MTDLSIIVPTLNEAHGIEAALARLQAWRAAGVEVIVVDGGSTDDTVVRAARLADRVLVHGPGRARQQNRGAQASRGALLLFLHADTILPDAALDALRGYACAATPLWGRFDVRLAGRHVFLRVIERCMSWRSRITGICTGDQAMFVSRVLFEAVGGFPDLPLMEDVALSALLRRRRWPRCLHDRAVTSSRRWERHGILRTVLRMWALRLAYFLGVPPARLAARYAHVRERG